MKTAGPVEQLVEDIRLVSPTLHDIVQGVRQIVRRAEPTVTEIVKYGGILFQVEQPLCGVYAYRQHVSLEFGRGREFEDSHGVLEGGGKFRRHIKLMSPGDLTSRHVAEYERQSLALSRQASAATSEWRTKR
jgi:hypothetical protein